MSNKTQRRTPQQGQAVFTTQDSPSNETDPKVVQGQVENKVAQEDPEVPDRPSDKPVFEEPYYEFGGANLGGQSIYECGICWCLVRRDFQVQHTEWHRSLHDAQYGG